MTAGAAHSALAAMIGDPVVVSGVTIPNGVRFSKAMRDAYMNRAMLALIDKYMAMAAAFPRHSDKAQLLSGIFPTFRREYTYSYAATQTVPALVSTVSTQPIFIYSASVTVSGNVTKLPVIGMEQVDSYRNTRMQANHYHDSFMSLVQTVAGVSQYRIYVGQNDSFTGGTVSITMLPRPTDISTIAGTSNIDFEPYMEDQMIRKAVQYALIDGQDIDPALLTQLSQEA